MTRALVLNASFEALCVVSTRRDLLPPAPLPFGAARAGLDSGRVGQRAAGLGALPGRVGHAVCVSCRKTGTFPVSAGLVPFVSNIPRVGPGQSGRGAARAGRSR